MYIRSLLSFDSVKCVWMAKKLKQRLAAAFTVRLYNRPPIIRQEIDQVIIRVAPCVFIADLHLRSIAVFFVSDNDSLYALIGITRTPRRLKPYVITDTEFSLVQIAQSFLSISLTLSTA